MYAGPAVRGNIQRFFRCIFFVEADPDRVALIFAPIDQENGEVRFFASKHGLRRAGIEMQVGEISEAEKDIHQRDAAEHKRQCKTQTETVISRRNKQDQQHQQKHPARFAWQCEDAALFQKNFTALRLMLKKNDLVQAGFPAFS